MREDAIERKYDEYSTSWLPLQDPELFPSETKLQEKHYIPSNSETKPDVTNTNPIREKKESERKPERMSILETDMH
jgi:hypothetical protein